MDSRHRNRAASGRTLRRGLLLCLSLLLLTAPYAAAQEPEIFPLDQIKPGMKGVAYTIFAGDKIEKFDLEVIGILPNLMGPKESIILVELKGPRVEHTGVVAGMSGSPVYIEGKLAGALSLKFGLFTKEPLAGVTPIQNVFDVPSSLGAQPVETASRQYAFPHEIAEQAGVSPSKLETLPASGVYLEPIETPLIFSGFQPGVLSRYEDQLTAYGMVAAPGGTAPARPDDAQIAAGDMISMVLVQGDLSISAACTVTAVVGERVYGCGHPLFNFGPVNLPMARGHVLTTLSSDLASTKIVNAGGAIGTLTQDRATAVLGRLGPPPRMIPVNLSISTATGERQFQFQIVDNAKLTPLLVGMTTFNGLTTNTAYSEGTTFLLTGNIQLDGHSPVGLENMFAPTDLFVPDGMFVASSVQRVFTQIYSNPYERAKIDQITLHVKSLPERRWATIDGAWSEKSEAQPGEKLNVKVLLRPYRGAPVIREVPITIPPQVARGTTLRVLVSDAEWVNRTTRPLGVATQQRLGGLEQLISLLNRERRNNRLYVTLLQPTPTLLVQDKELPNAPLSEINVLDQRRTAGGAMLLRESTVGEWSVPMNQVISGFFSLSIRVK